MFRALGLLVVTAISGAVVIWAIRDMAKLQAEADRLEKKAGSVEWANRLAQYN